MFWMLRGLFCRFTDREKARRLDEEIVLRERCPGMRMHRETRLISANGGQNKRNQSWFSGGLKLPLTLRILLFNSLQQPGNFN